MIPNRSILDASSALLPWPRAIRALAACAAFNTVAVTLSATTVNWTGNTSALWDTATNWLPNALPSATDDAVFPATLPASGGSITLSAGETASSLTFRNNYILTGGSLTLGSAGAVTVAATRTATISSILQGVGGLSLVGSNGLAGADLQAGGGTLVLTGTNTYGGPTSISAGVLSIADTANLGSASATNTIAMSGGTLQSTGSAVSLGATRTVQVTSSGAPAADGAIFDVTGSNTLTVNGIISGAATDAITKTGTGTLVLSGNNSNNGTGGFLGNILIKGGFISIGGKKSGAINTDTTINLGDAGNDIFLDGGGIRWTGAQGSSATGRWTITPTQVWNIGSNGGTIDIPAMQSSKIHFRPASGGGADDQIRGSGTITRTGVGPLTIENSNPNFTGSWVLNGGVLEARGTAALGSTSSPVPVIVSGISELAHAPAASGGIMANPITMNGGAISPENFNAVFSGPITFNNSSSVRLGDWYQNAARNATFSGQLTGNGAITVAMGSFGTNVFISGGSLSAGLNTGTLFLTNDANALSGLITVNNNLKVNTAAADGNGSTIGSADFTLAGGTLQLRDNGIGSTGVLDYASNDITVVANAGSGATTGTATIDVNRAGGSNVENTFRLGGLSIGAQQLDISGGNGYSVQFTGVAQLSGTPTLNVTTADLTLSAGAAGVGAGITKTGAGTLRLAAASVYTGATTVSGGTLAVIGSISGTSGVSVESGATLAGSGTIDSQAPVTIASGGTISPGASVGTLHTGSATFAGGALQLEIVDFGGFDQLDVTGSVSLNGPVTLSLAVSGTSSAGSVFTIINNDGSDAITLSGASSRFTFNSVPLNEGDIFTVSGAFGSESLKISYSGGTGNDVTLTVVPEPESATVLAGAAAVLVALQRLRRRR